jgi:hypothetical protein
MSLAAYEAFKISGWDASRAAMDDLKSELETYRRASAVDDEKDDDKNGVSDVSELTSQALIQRKVSLALRVSDPGKVNAAVSGIVQGCVGVLASLKFKHARTVALGVSVGNSLRRPASLYITPLIAQLIPEEHRKWIPYLLDYICKTVAVTIAWYISAVISTVQCAIRGGLMFSRSILKHLNDTGYMTVDPEESYLDEALGWGVAAFGAMWQVWNGFGLPFPLNLLLLPFRVVEYYLNWIVLSGE